jgi:hypothetical protein
MQKDKKQPELADIFRRYGENYRQNHCLSTEQSKTMHRIEICRTRVPGGNSEACDQFGFQQNYYNFCRDRHCPKCQTLRPILNRALSDNRVDSLVVPNCKGELVCRRKWGDQQQQLRRWSGRSSNH